MDRAPRNRPVGAFLMEVVFASFIFSAVLGSVVALWVHHDRALSLTRQSMVAGVIAEQTMSRCLAAGFYFVDELAAAPPRVVEVVQEIDGVEQAFEYRTAVRVQLQPDEDLKLITVSVAFIEREVERTVELHHVLYWQ